jgi:triphosphatase
MLLFARWLAQPRAGAADGAGSIVKFAAEAMRKHHRRLMARAHRALDGGAKERHKLRIEAKRARYAIEGFAGVFAAKRAAPYLEGLAALQAELGNANDAAVARRHVEELGWPAAAAKHAQHWLAARERKGASHIGERVERLEKSKGFAEKD